MVLNCIMLSADDAALVRQGLMSHLAEQGGEKEDRGRVEVLPIQWRKHLDLDVSIITHCPKEIHLFL